MTLTDEFKKVCNHQDADDKLLVPLLIWCSGYEKNIELCQRINRKFFNCDKSVLIKELTLYNSLNHFIKYPKSIKDDEKLEFFYKDICKCFGWSMREFRLHSNVLDTESIKEDISRLFAYEKKECKLLGIKR